MTNYEWIKKHTLLEIIKDTLDRTYTVFEDQDQVAFVSWLLEEHKEGYEDVQFPEDSESINGGSDLPF